MRKNNKTFRAFTLVELILVMAVLATLLALAVPSLSRSMRGRNLQQEAKRFVALTEYARSEAISQGVPMTVWISPDDGRFGIEALPGFPSAASKQREFKLNSDVHFEMDTALSSQAGTITAVQFAPDGTPDTTSVDSVRLVDRTDSAISIAKNANGLGYEIVKDN